MARLASYYSLCPLIDTKSLIDVSNDPQEGVVIVTLGKNIASRYKISDQKQLTCWRTKEKFSSPVLFCPNKSKYVAIFNQSYLKMWDEDGNLDKLKKYKFNKPMHTLVKIRENIFILFQNGAIHNLNNVLEDRKTLNPAGLDVKQIDYVLCEELNDQIYFGLVSDTVLYWTKFEEHKCKFSKICLERNELNVKGYIFHVIREVVYLLTLWSDGSIFSRPLEDSSLDENNVGDLFTVVDSVSLKHFVCLKSLDENYIALYGANSNEEGAMLALYNLQFKVTQSKQPFKLFTNHSKIWRINNNLLLPVGQNLAVIPFHLETEQLAALVGSHRDIQTDLDPDVKIIEELNIASWETGKEVQIKILPYELKEKIDQFANQGLPESTILEEILPDIFEKNDNTLLADILKNFSDIPEKYLVKILIHAVNIKKYKLISNVLHRSFNEVLIVPYLRSELPIDGVSVLLSHIYKAWLQNKTLIDGLNNVETERKLLEWSCAVIDSNYQKIVLSNDKTVIETLNKLSKLVQQNLSYLESLKEIVPLLSNIQKKKDNDRCLNVNNLRYSIEQISLY